MADTTPIGAQSFQLFRSLRTAPPRKRLWLAGIAVGLFLLTIVVGNQFIPREKAVTREMLGHDFLAFYTAGSFVNQGRYHDLYKLDPVKNFEQSTARQAGLEVGKSFGPWWNPPFYALVFQPLATLPYARALDIWRWISLGAVIIAIALLARMVAQNQPDFRTWGLVPLLILTSMPFIQAFSHGQNTFTSLLLLTVTVWFWRSERKFLAGVFCGLLFYKPQLAAVVAAVMVLDLGWKSVAGLAFTGTNLLLLTMLKMPGSITDYLHLLPANVHWMQVENAYLWERHVTIKAFWRLLLQGREAGEMALATTILTYVSLAVVGGALLIAALRNRATPRSVNSRDRLIAATIAVMPLLMPFYFDYDLLLLAIPVTLYAAERVKRPCATSKIDLSLTQAWIGLYFWLYLNPAVALRTHLNVTVLLVFAVAVFLVERAMRGQKSFGQLNPTEIHEFRLAA